MIEFNDECYEAYLQGAKDFRDAIIAMASDEKEGGMTEQEIMDVFEVMTPNGVDIMKHRSVEEIIQKVQNWKEERKTKPLNVGDEVQTDNGKTYVVLGPTTSFAENSVKALELSELEFTILPRDSLWLTGKTYDNIPLRKEKPPEIDDTIVQQQPDDTFDTVEMLRKIQTITN